MNIQPLVDLVNGAPPRLSRAELADRYRSVMLGVAAGDLLGLPVEGSPRWLVQKLHPKGLRDISAKELSRAWDDDLAQTAILAELLTKGGPLNRDAFAKRLVRWGHENGRGMGNLTRRVLDILDAGGDAIEAARIVWETDGHQPAGNGAVMRCAPVALRWLHDPERLVRDSLASAEVTHYDQRCQWSTAAMNVALAITLRGHDFDLEALAKALNEAGADHRVGKAVRSVKDTTLDDLQLDESDKIGYTLKAMQAGLWALTSDGTLENTLLAIVNEGGDTDTNGAVAGAALGALHGSRSIPERWVKCIGSRERLETLARAVRGCTRGVAAALHRRGR